MAITNGKECGGARRHASRGQILPVMLFGFFVTIISLLAVFNASRVTIEKTQLVNAADAAAYSGAVQAARSLNFFAYSTRAMVANTIAVGYVVSYVSWLRYMGDFLNEVSTPRQFLVKVMKNFGESAVDSYKNVVDTITNTSESRDRRDDRLSQGNGEGNRANATARADQTGFHAIGASLRNAREDKRKGPGEALKTMATLLGFMTVGPTDLLNWFYAATQIATYAATPSVVDDTMAQVAKSYDENIDVADTNSLEFLYWVIPMRPGLDAFGFVNLAGRLAGKTRSLTVEANPFGAFDRIPGLKQVAKGLNILAKPIGSALGWTKQEVEGKASDFNLGVMYNYVLTSMTKHDAWWIWYNRGWRVCLPTIVCLPPIFPSQIAIDKYGQTALFMGARPPNGNSPFAKPATPEDQQPLLGPGANSSHQQPVGINNGDANIGNGNRGSANDGNNNRENGHTGDFNDGSSNQENRDPNVNAAIRRNNSGVGGTGVWIVALETKSGARPMPVGRRTGDVGKFRLVPVASRLPAYSQSEPSSLPGYVAGAIVDEPYPSSGGGAAPRRSKAPALPSIPENFIAPSDAGTIADQADRQAANDPDVVREARGGGNYLSRAKGRLRASRVAVGAGAKKTVQQVKKGLVAAGGKAVNMGRYLKRLALPVNGSLVYGANWVAGDVLSNGLFANLLDVIVAFVAAPFTGGDSLTNLRYNLKVLAQGEASAKEFFKPYQGVPTYMMLTELPFTNLHPEMVIEVDLERPADDLGLYAALGFGEQDVSELQAHAAAKVFYYRQPNDEQNDYFKAVGVSPLNVFTVYLAQTPASQRLENWYGSTQWFTAFVKASEAAQEELEFSEFDNVFNPFWEVRLVDD